MKKTIISLLIISSLGIIKADYTVKIPLENNNGHLPEGSINIGNTSPIINPEEPSNEVWLPYDPEYTEWVDGALIYECNNWTPDPSTVSLGESFTQTSDDCKQDQTRSRQDREQESTTLSIRNKGIPITETNTIIVSSTRTSTGTKTECYDDPSICYGNGNNYVHECSFKRSASIYGGMPYSTYWFNNSNNFDSSFAWDEYMISARGDDDTTHYNPEGGIFYRGRFIEDIANSFGGNYYEGKIYEVCYYGPEWIVGDY